MTMADIETESEREIESGTEGETESAMESATFMLDDEFIRSQQKICREEARRVEGDIRLPRLKNFISHVIVDVDADLAREVKTLHLGFNPVTIMEPEENLKKFSQLRTLFCDGCRLSAFPAWILSLTTIEKLLLQTNGFPDIPPQISAFTSLKKIIFVNNKLRKLPSFLMELDSLEVVWAQSNKIEEVESVGRVRKLLLDGNKRLKTIPTGIHLTTVHISGCDIRRLPDDFFRFNLETLKISGNKGKEMKMG